jgi:hypothetical protein
MNIQDVHEKLFGFSIALLITLFVIFQHYFENCRPIDENRDLLSTDQQSIVAK